MRHDVAGGADYVPHYFRGQVQGYLYLPGYLDREEVLECRRHITGILAGEGYLDPASPSMEAVTRKGEFMGMRSELGASGTPLHRLLYSGRMIEFYTHFLGGAVRHFDYTWVRAVQPEGSTPPHTDIVYMGRGTQKLYTAWVPIGDITYELGGLMILEKSHQHKKINENYGRRDVDTYCTNHADAPLIESGKKMGMGQWNGSLSNNPVSLREKLGGRWLTAEFRAGDFVTFGMFTVHSSIENHTRSYRLSSDSRYQLASEPVDGRWIGEKPIAHGVAGKRGRIC